MILLRPICWLLGHKRGKWIGETISGGGYRYFRCPRCGRETRYKVKDQNHGSPGDEV